MQHRVRLIDQATGASEVVRLGRLPVAPSELVVADLAGARRFHVMCVLEEDGCDARALVRTVELRIDDAESDRRVLAARTPPHGIARDGVAAEVRRRLAG